MSCCVDDELTLDAARTACARTLKDAVTTASSEDQGQAVLVDAIPSLGKSRSAAMIAQAEWCDHDVTILTHRVEIRKQLADWAADAGVDVQRLPRFDDACATAAGDYGDTWRERVRDLRRRGLSPGRLHRDPRYDLPCCESEQCEYMERWTDVGEQSLLIGHPTHAYVPEVIQDRVVIFDEDPGEAYRYDFDADAVHRITSEFLTEVGLEWPDDVEQSAPTSKSDLTGFRKYAPADRVEEIVSALRDQEIYTAVECVGRVHGHGAARAIIISLLDPNREELGNNVERIQLPGGVAVYDDSGGALSIRRPPDLSTATGIVALDGTPVKRIWDGRLGLQDQTGLQQKRVLCNDCRQQYLTEVLGYQILQTSTHVRPYSSGHAINLEKDLALLEAIAKEHGTDELAVISSKKAIAEYEAHEAPIGDSGHYSNIKGTNKFEGDEHSVGVVIGSPHPGDPEIKRLAALNGDAIDIETAMAKRGNELTYGVTSQEGEPADPYLAHFREQRVAQAVFRFGRQNGATVYVHTSAVPDWLLTEGALESEDEIFTRRRSAGEREVLEALMSDAELAAGEITERVDIASSTVYDRLEDLAADGIVEKRDSSWPAQWRLVDGEAQPSNGHVVRDRWYVKLPTRQ